MMKRTLAIIMSVIMCSALIFTGCSNDNELNETVVATVGGVEISQADYNLMYRLSLGDVTQYQSYGEGWYNTEIDDKGATIGSSIKEMTMNSIIEIIAITKLAEENGIKADADINADVNEQIRILKENYGGENGYKNFLDEYRTTDEAVRTYFERAALYNSLFEKLSAEGGVAYVKNEDVLPEFTEKYMRVQHILISTQPETDAEGNEIPAKTDEEALAIANEVIAKLDGGADFDSLIDEYDEDPGMTSGNYYTFTDGQMVPEFEEEAKNLAVGEYSKTPVATDYGYHIVKKYDVVAEGQEFDAFKQEKAQVVISDIIDTKVGSLKVEKKDDVINKYLDAWLKDLGVNINAPVTKYAAPQTETTGSEEPVAEGEETANTATE